MNRTGVVSELRKAVEEGLIYVGISAGSRFAAGSFEAGLRLIENPIIPHWKNKKMTVLPDDDSEIRLADGQAVYISNKGMELLG